MLTLPKIQALGITQEWTATRWKARGYVEGVGWLEAWGPSLITETALYDVLSIIVLSIIATRATALAALK